MSEFGPLPEQPVTDDRIALLDLRDRIHLEHHVPPLTPLGQAVDKERARITEQNRIRIDAKVVNVALATAIVLAWALKPTLLIVLVLVCLAILIARR